MPTATLYKNQSPDLQQKSIEGLQHKKRIDMKKANSSKICKPACLLLSKSAQQIQYKPQWSVALKLFL